MRKVDRNASTVPSPTTEEVDPSLFYTSKAAYSNPAIYDSKQRLRAAAEGTRTEDEIVDEVPLRQIELGHEWVYTRAMRCPSSDTVRPTTLDGTEAPIRVSHALSVEIRYRLDGTEADKILTVQKPIVIGSVSNFPLIVSLSF